MAHPFDIPAIEENPILVKLAVDLEGTLHVIAHAGKASDVEFIRGRQAAFREDYDRHFDGDSLHPFSAGTFLEIAYHGFLHLLDDNPTEEEIAQKCEDILYSGVMPDC